MAPRVTVLLAVALLAFTSAATSERLPSRFTRQAVSGPVSDHTGLRYLSSSSSTATGTSRSFNPAISVNGLFLGFYTSDPLAREPVLGEGHDHDGGDHEHAHAHGLPEDTGLSVQEVEVRFSAERMVDEYLAAYRRVVELHGRTQQVTRRGG